jgi:hypothetical protein
MPQNIKKSSFLVSFISKSLQKYRFLKIKTNLHDNSCTIEIKIIVLQSETAIPKQNDK